MPRSYPDWSNVRREVTYILREDLAELAARLGSPDVFDRRGNVLLIETFEKGLGSWVALAYGDGAEVTLSTTYPKHSPFAARLTGGSTGVRSAEIDRSVAPSGSKRIGLEISVAFLTDFDKFEVWLYYYDSSQYHSAAICLSDTDQKVYYQNATGSFQEICDLPEAVYATGVYHNLKLVADFEADEYIRLILNDTEYSLAECELRAVSDTSLPRHELYLIMYSRSGENDVCQIGHVIVTQDEE
jgi:hypothetical protein